MKLIGIDTQPIAFAHVLSRLMKYPSAQPRFGEENRFFAERNDALVVSGKLLHDLPRIIDTARVEDIDRIGPAKELLNALSENIGFIANGQQRVKSHPAICSMRNGPFSSIAGRVSKPVG